MRPSHPALFTAVLIAVLLIATPLMAQEEPTPKRILVLNSFDKGVPWESLVEKGMEQVFQSIPSGSLEVNTEYLDLARYPGQANQDLLVQLLKKKYSIPPVDLVLVNDYPACKFILKYGPEIFPDIPMVLSATGKESILESQLPANMTIVYQGMDFAGTLDLALKVLPATRHVYVLAGCGRIDRRFEKKARKDLAPYEDRVDVRYCSDLTAGELLKKVGKLSPDSIIYFLAMTKDTADHDMISRDMLTKVSQQANAPVFSLWESYFGHGIVGGKMISAELQGETVAKTGLRVLAGTKPSQIPPTLLPHVDMFDWRQLKRWNLLDAPLPAGSEVRFVEMSLYERYREYFMALAALFILIAALVAVLLLRLSQKKRALRGMKENKSQYRKVFEYFQDVYYETSIDGRILEISPTVYDIFGYHREDLLGKNVNKFYADPAQRTEITGLLLNKGLARDLELTLRARDGSKRICSENVLLVRDKDGQPLKFIGSLRDITERKRTEKALRESEDKYRSVVEDTPVLMCGSLPGGEIVFVNQAYCDFFGKTSHELLGNNLFDLAPESDSQRIKDKFESLTPAAPTASSEHKAICSSGKFRWLRWNDRALFDEAGNLRFFQSYGVDITDSKKIEEDLRASRERMMAIFIANPDPMVVYDNQGLTLFVNPAFTRVFGWTIDELRGQRIPFVPKEEAERSLAMIKELYASNQMVDFVSKRLTKSGDALGVQISAAPVRGADFSVVGMVVNLRDVTELRKMEAQQRQAQKMEAVGTLAGGIAHDFNNILAAISGYAELALEDAHQGMATPDELERILKAAFRARNLVKQILTFSRRVDQQIKPVEVNHEVINAVNLLRPIFPRMIEIELDLSENAGRVLADTNQLEQLIINLATNSRDAMPEGGKLAVKTSLVDIQQDLCCICFNEFSGQYVLISVSDNGKGMGPKELEKIFDPFFTTKEVGRGTGLGMSTVFGVVRAHQGHITIDSRPDEGTTVNIYLPVHQPKEEEDTPEIEEAAPPMGGDETIMLVDDEDAVLDVASRFLSLAGYKVIRASTGEEALETFRRHKGEIDLVILDLSMPGMGGQKCQRELLTLDPKLKIIIATGYSRGGSIQETLSSGSAGFIAKPFSKAELLRVARETLDA